MKKIDPTKDLWKRFNVIEEDLEAVKSCVHVLDYCLIGIASDTGFDYDQIFRFVRGIPQKIEEAKKKLDELGHELTEKAA